MKKIIVAFDGLKYAVPTQEYAVKLASENNALLVGVFLDDLYYHSYRVYDIIQETEGGIDTKLQKSFDKKDMAVRTKAIKMFVSACEKAGIQFSIHKDHKAAFRELLKESIYADLLVISSSENFFRSKEEIPTPFIHHILPHIQCPVFVVPATYRQIDELVLLYDGEPSSVHAIKMLGYVLSPFQDMYTEIVTVKKQRRGSGRVPEAGLIKEFISQHFPNTRFHLLHGEAEAEILAFLKKKRSNTLVVLGAYRRSTVSRWFRPSMADLLVSKLSLPLFIAHNK